MVNTKELKKIGDILAECAKRCHESSEQFLDAQWAVREQMREICPHPKGEIEERKTPRSGRPFKICRICWEILDV
jgi:hypothetical protein